METILTANSSAFLPPRSASSSLSRKNPIATTTSKTHHHHHRTADDNASKGSFGLSPPPRRQRSSTQQPQESPKVEVTNTEDSTATVVSAATPSSVKVSLTRDLSDLSGSYAAESKHSGTSTTTNSNHHHHQSALSKKATVIAVPKGEQPWRQAKILSSRSIPQHPQPPCDDDLSVGIRKVVSHDLIEIVTLNTDLSSNASSSATTTEIMDSSSRTRSSFRNKNNNKKHERTPILLLLMDPTRKSYEILQLWIDTETDTVKDVLNTVSRTLGPAWKQDYDGIFAIRNNHFSQLIHVLPVHQYDVHPYEVWVCKPWSMSARSTVGYASTLLNHLKEIGTLEYAKANEYSKIWKKHFCCHYHYSNKKKRNNINNNSNDTLLVLSNKALSRVYVPGGILKHHHAFQFLSFAPPFEEPHQYPHYHSHTEDQEDDDAVSSAMSESNLSTADTEDNLLVMNRTQQHPERVIMVPHDLSYDHDDHHQQQDDEGLETNHDAAEEDSTTQSTFSTSGTTSPTRTSLTTMPLLSKSASSSSFKNTQQMELSSSPIPHVLPSSMKHKSNHHHQQQQPAPPRRIVRLLSALNCSRNNSDSHKDKVARSHNMHSRTHWSYQQTPTTTTSSSSSSSSPFQQYSYYHNHQAHDIHSGFSSGYRSILEAHDVMDRVLEEDAQSRASSSAPLLIVANSSDYFHDE